MIDFGSDNTHGCSPEILEALARANAGTMSSYGDDEITARVRERCREIFECDLEIFPVLTGTAGNALSIAAMTPASGSIVCHEEAPSGSKSWGRRSSSPAGGADPPIGCDGKLRAVDVKSVEPFSCPASRRRPRQGRSTASKRCARFAQRRAARAFTWMARDSPMRWPRSDALPPTSPGVPASTSSPSARRRMARCASR